MIKPTNPDSFENLFDDWEGTYNPATREAILAAHDQAKTDAVVAALEGLKTHTFLEFSNLPQSRVVAVVYIDQAIKQAKGGGDER